MQQHLDIWEVEKKFGLENTEINIIHLEATNKITRRDVFLRLSDLPEAELESCSCSVVKLCPSPRESQTLAHPAPLSMGFPRQDTGVCCYFLLQGIFLTQELNPHLLHWQVNSLPLSHLETPELGCGACYSGFPGQHMPRISMTGPRISDKSELKI